MKKYLGNMTMQLSILGATALGLSAPAFAIGSYVDFHTQSQSCPAAWTWSESTRSSGKYVPNNCAMKDAILVVNEEPLKNPNGAEVIYKLAEYQVGILASPDDHRYAIIRAKEIAMDTFKKSGAGEHVFTVPEIVNKEYLTPSYLYYDSLNKQVEILPEQIKEVEAVVTTPNACVNCQVGSYDVAIYFHFKQILYTIPTRPGKVKVDNSCPDEVWQEVEETRYGKGRSAPMVTLAEVSDPSYVSVDGNSLPGATHDSIWCPNGLNAFGTPNPEGQVNNTLSWLYEQGSNLDVGSKDVQAMIKYLMSLALEKTSELTNTQLSRILALHKLYPQLAFPDEETEANAVETSAAGITQARAQWALIEKRLIALPNSSDTTTLSDINTRIGNSDVILFRREPTTDARLSYSSFRQALAYIVSDSTQEILTFFREDGSILVSSRDGQTVYKPGSAERASLVEKIKSDLTFYKQGPQATADAKVLKTIDLFYKYLNPPAQVGEITPAEQAVIDTRKALKEAIGFEPNVNVSLNFNRGLRLGLGQDDVDFKLRYWLYSAPDTVIAFSRTGITWEMGSSKRTYLVKSPEYYTFLNDEMKSVDGSIDRAASTDPTKVSTLQAYKAYLQALSAVK